MSGNGPRRRRGVRASPEKLQQALAESGLKTRIAVAERIADLEASASVPSGMVNRAFRGVPVDPQSLQRIARALDVEAHTLYLASQEKSMEAEDGSAGLDVAESTPPCEPDAKTGFRKTARWIFSRQAALIGIAMLAFLGAGAWFAGALRQSGVIVEDTRPADGNPYATTVVITSNNQTRPDLESALAQALAAHWRVLPRPGDGDVDAQRWLSLPGVDKILEIDSRTEGRFVGIRIGVHQPDTMRIVWRGAARRLADASEIAALMQRAAHQIVADDPKALLPAEALSRYLSGRSHLDQVRTELNLRRALTEFESAVRLAPAFGDAHAGVCEALVLDHVRTGHPARLSEAAHACARAHALDAQSLEARRAQAYLDRKRGELSRAIAGFREVLAASPSSTDAWRGLAEAHLTRFGRGEGHDAWEEALAAAKQAVALEPRFWKTAFALARVHYYGGRLDEAVATARNAVALDANVLTLSNLGSFEYCRGNLDAARAAYERARREDAAAFVGQAQLGVVHYFRHDYERAVESFEEALELYREGGEAADHRLWGNYAHALRQSGRLDDAVSAYARATVLAQAALNDGDGRAHHAVYLTFYDEMLYRLTGPPNRRPSRADLDALADTTDPIGQLYLSILYRLHGEKDTAEALKRRGASGCPGFALSPDFELPP